MKSRRLKKIAFFLALFIMSGTRANLHELEEQISSNSDIVEQEAPRRTNVLFIIVDDLRPLAASDAIHVPNMSRLAREGIHFENAYSQQALCAPSRNSLLTGRRPDSLQLYDFYSYWRHTVGNFTTLPQLFRENGYDTYSVGKIFHPGKSSNFTDDYPYSWSYPPYHPPTEQYKDWPVCKDNQSNELHDNLVCPVDVEEQPEKTLPDLEILQRATDILQRRKLEKKAFFLGVGFHKPHIPLKFPKEYLDLYPLENITQAEQPNRPYGMPQVAWHPSTDIRRRDDISKLNISFPFGIMPDLWARKIKQSYFSCVSYVDHLVGQLFTHVDWDNTIVVVTSDHGWSLGENGLWAKYSNFDTALKVPLIIHVPGARPKQIKQPIELIDIFPTLVEIAGIKSDIPKCSETSNKLLCFEGKSLVPFMNTVNSKLNKELIALSQYPRPSEYPQYNSDKPKLKYIKIMGYSLRTERFRYTEWVEFDHTMFIKNWSRIHGVELYDHSIDAYESLNLYNRPGLEKIIKYFSNLLRGNNL